MYELVRVPFHQKELAPMLKMICKFQKIAFDMMTFLFEFDSTCNVHREKLAHTRHTGFFKL